MPKTIIVENELIHVEGGYAKQKQCSSLGSVGVNVHLSSITQLKMVKKIDTTEMVDQPTRIKVKTFRNIAHVVNLSGIIGIEGYLKFEVEKVENKFTGTLYQGCMVDYEKVWKIKLHLKTMQAWVLPEGTHIKAIGQILIGSYNRPFLFVASPMDVIQMSEQTLSAFEMRHSDSRFSSQVGQGGA